MASHMGVQTFATARNSQVEVLVHYVFQKFFDHLISVGEVLDAKVTVQKEFTSAIANDIWDLFVLARRANGTAIELWCQTTCYKGNNTGRPEPNKTYEVRETLVEALSIRERFVDTPGKSFRSVHVTVGDSRYTYQWFMDLKSACFDKSVYMNCKTSNIFDDLAAAFKGTLTESQRFASLDAICNEGQGIGPTISGIVQELVGWWNGGDISRSKLADAQWSLVAPALRANLVYSSLHRPGQPGADIKGRARELVMAAAPSTSDAILAETVDTLLSKNPFLRAARAALKDWTKFIQMVEDLAVSSRDLNDLVMRLWQSPPPARLLLRRLVLRISSEDSIAYIQDLDVAGVTEHNLYSGDHNAEQVKNICSAVNQQLLRAEITSPTELCEAFRKRGRALMERARWFEAQNGTELKPSFDYVELFLKKKGFRILVPSKANVTLKGYHAELSSETVNPYQNLKLVASKSGSPICLLKAKFFREQEFPRRCKEEAFVGLSLKFKFEGGKFSLRRKLPLIMFVDMPRDCDPPDYSVRRLVSFGWQVVFSTDDLYKLIEG